MDVLHEKNQYHDISSNVDFFFQKKKINKHCNNDFIDKKPLAFNLPNFYNLQSSICFMIVRATCKLISINYILR